MSYWVYCDIRVIWVVRLKWDTWCLWVIWVMLGVLGHSGHVGQVVNESPLSHCVMLVLDALLDVTL